MLLYREDAEEACQDALLQVAENIAAFRGRSKFTTWLYAVATNSARMTLRLHCRRRQKELYAETTVEAADPRTTSVIAGTRLDLLDALDRLGSEKADLVPPLVLRDLCGLSYKEVADHLSLPIGTIKARIHDARQEMRLLLGQRATGGSVARRPR